MEVNMKVISRIPTKEQYSYLELQGEVEEFVALSKEDLLKIVNKHEGAIKVYKAQMQTPEDKFIDSLN